VNNQSAVKLNLPPGAKIQHHGGGRFCLMGAIDFDNAGQVMADGQRLFVDHNAVIIDTSSAEVSNSAGLAVLMEWASWCDTRDISLVYEGMQASVLAVAEMNGVTMMLPVGTPKLDVQQADT
jgi:anti-anti-sigma regulatory factor